MKPETKHERMLRTLKHMKKRENKMAYNRAKIMDDRRTKRNRTRSAQEKRALDEYYLTAEEDYGDFDLLIGDYDTEE